jgi:hypothetical protein
MRRARTLLCSAPPRHMSIFVCLATHATLTCQPPHLTSLLLTPRVVFLGYSDHHKGYRCLDLSTNRLMISRYVVFDEAVFPFATSPHPTNDLDFLLSEETPMILPIGTPLLAGLTSSCLVHWSPPHQARLPSPRQVRLPWLPHRYVGLHQRFLRVSCLMRLRRLLPHHMRPRRLLSHHVRTRQLLSHPARLRRLLPLQHSALALHHRCGLPHRSPTSVVHIGMWLRLQRRPRTDLSRQCL